MGQNRMICLVIWISEGSGESGEGRMKRKVEKGG